jgi:hypothetical protein
MPIRFDKQGNAHSVGVRMYDPQGYIPHPVQRMVPTSNRLNPNYVSGAKTVGPIMVPGHEVSLFYNVPKRGN